MLDNYLLNSNRKPKDFTWNSGKCSRCDFGIKVQCPKCNRVKEISCGDRNKDIDEQVTNELRKEYKNIYNSHVNRCKKQEDKDEIVEGYENSQENTETEQSEDVDSNDPVITMSALISLIAIVLLALNVAENRGDLKVNGVYNTALIVAVISSSPLYLIIVFMEYLIKNLCKKENN